MDDIEYFTIQEMFGTGKNIYPLIYAIQACGFKDFYYVVPKEAYYVGMSVCDDTPSHEVVYLDEGDGLIDTPYDGAFPINSLPAVSVFLRYKEAREFCENTNEALIDEYSKTHFQDEVEDAKEEMDRAVAFQDRIIYKGINEDDKEHTLFSTVYQKTKRPS